MDSKLNLSKMIRVMVIGAHPDDAELCAGGTVLKFQASGALVNLVSFLNGDKGHMSMQPAELKARRHAETQRVKKVLGINDYQVFPDQSDGELVASIEMRKKMTCLIRKFDPHVIFTHRTCDYHADHRAVGVLVQDAAYLLGVPLWCPETPIPQNKPVLFYMSDAFKTPAELRPDIVVDIDAEMGQLLEALCEHESQFFEWLRFDRRITETVPGTLEGRKAFIGKYWLNARKELDANRFRSQLTSRYGEQHGNRVRFAEAFELSEYGYLPSAEELKNLFPFLPKKHSLSPTIEH
ncbi:MAG: PIG-L deacetylase family protein [bacterium]